MYQPKHRADRPVDACTCKVVRVLLVPQHGELAHCDLYVGRHLWTGDR